MISNEMKSIHTKVFQHKVLPAAIAKWERIVADLETPRFLSDGLYPDSWFVECSMCDWATYDDDDNGCLCPLWCGKNVNCHTEYDAAMESLANEDVASALVHAKELLKFIRSLADTDINEWFEVKSE